MQPYCRHSEMNSASITASGTSAKQLSCCHVIAKPAKMSENFLKKLLETPSITTKSSCINVPYRTGQRINEEIKTSFLLS